MRPEQVNPFAPTAELAAELEAAANAAPTPDAIAALAHPPKKKRGRKPHTTPEVVLSEPIIRKRGRPRKYPLPTADDVLGEGVKVKKKMGRPSKAAKAALAYAQATGTAIAIPPERLVDETFYVEQLGKLAGAFAEGKIEALEFHRGRQAWTKMYESITGQDLAESARNLRDPIKLLADESILARNEQDVAKIRAAILALPGLDEQKKTRWLALCDQIPPLQHLARSAAEPMAVYVGRDSEDNTVFKMAEIHHRFYSIFADTSKGPHVVMQAPFGMSKSTSLRYWKVWEVSNDPTLRCLNWLDQSGKARRENETLKKIFRSGPYRALYPHIRVLGKRESAQDCLDRFTVTRVNAFSREPTFEAAGNATRVGGSGFDRIYADDVCQEEVINQPQVRQAIINKFTNDIEKRRRDPKRFRIIMIGNCWHPQDLLGHLIEQASLDHKKGWNVAVSEFAIQDDENGKAISPWGDRYNSEYFEDQKLAHTAADYDRMYRLNPSPTQERLVHFLCRYSENCDWENATDEMRTKVQREMAVALSGEHWLSVDPSATSGRASTETAATLLSLSAHGRAYVRAAYFFPGNPVAFQQWLVGALTGGEYWPAETEPAVKKWPLPERVDKMLFEAQGGMKGTVLLWEDYIYRELKKAGQQYLSKLAWRNTGTGGTGGGLSGQNISKGQRVSNCASYFANGSIVFPGRATGFIGADTPGGPPVAKVKYGPASNEGVQKLMRQLLNFPNAGTDGVDTLTQFIRWNDHRLVAVKEQEEAAFGGRFDPIQAAMKKAVKAQIEAACKPPNPDHEEYEWLKSLSQVA